MRTSLELAKFKERFKNKLRLRFDNCKYFRKSTYFTNTCKVVQVLTTQLHQQLLSPKVQAREVLLVSQSTCAVVQIRLYNLHQQLPSLKVQVREAVLISQSTSAVVQVRLNKLHKQLLSLKVQVRERTKVL